MMMIERVAMALWGTPANKRAVSWGAMDERTKDLWRSDARIAIEAMREPTDGMTVKGKQCCMDECVDKYGVGKTYRAMIDAALSEGQPLRNDTP